MRKAAFHPWPLASILEYLERAGGSVHVSSAGGKTNLSLVWPDRLTPQERDERTAFIVPHLSAKRAELIDHMARTCPGLMTPGPPPEPYDPVAVRKGIVSRVRAEAIARGVTFYYLLRDGRPVESDHKARRFGVKKRGTLVTIPIDREATHVAYAGGQWQALPKVTTRNEDALLSRDRDDEERRKARRKASRADEVDRHGYTPDLFD